MIAFVAFSLRRAWQGFWRNGLMSLAATASMVLMLAMLSGVVILWVGLDATLGYVESQVEVVAYLKDSATPQDVSLLQADLKAMPQVASVTYVSKEQALADFQKRQPDVANLVNALPSNPLPASFEIGLRVAVLVVVGLTVLFIIVNTIRLAVVARAEEIEIMRLVGASDAFIRWPFIFEGALVGLVGAAITIGLLMLVQARLAGLMSDFFNVLPVQASAMVGQNVALIVLVTGVGIGVLGSYLSVHSYLRR